jgi:hypothetical protein
MCLLPARVARSVQLGVLNACINQKFPYLRFTATHAIQVSPGANLNLIFVSASLPTNTPTPSQYLASPVPPLAQPVPQPHHAPVVSQVTSSQPAHVPTACQCARLAPRGQLAPVVKITWSCLAPHVSVLEGSCLTRIR